MLYRLLRAGIRQGLRVFFYSIRVVGAPPVEQGPLIVVSNHPNFVVDPLLLGVTYTRPLWFLAKATLFRHPLAAWVLTALGVLPVYRRQEGAGQSAGNRETFSQVSAQLARGEAIAIFPEGTSMGERRLYPVKTGAARMAFQALDEGVARTLLVQPVGLVYTDIDEFQSRVTIVLGEPIPAKDFYVPGGEGEDQRESVRQFTNCIEARLRALSVHMGDPDRALLMEKVGKLYASAGYDENDFARLSLIATHLENDALVSGARRHEIEVALDEYLAAVARWGLSGGASLVKGIPWPLWTILLLPVSCGTLIHAIPYHATGPLARRMAHHPVEIATRKFLVGAFLFCVWYGALGVGAWWSGLAVRNIILALGAVVICGLLANRWLGGVLLMLYRALPRGLSPLPKLLKLQEALLTRCEELRRV